MIARPVFWAVAAFAAAADLASKTLVFDWLGGEGPRAYTVIEGFFRIATVRNEGGVWGIGQDFTWVFAAVRFAALFIILYLLRANRRPSIAFLVGLGLIFGGAIGNLWDTVALGAVRDFLEFDLQFMVWPTFNIADSCITVGAVLLFFHFFLGGERVTSQDKAGVESPPS